MVLLFVPALPASIRVGQMILRRGWVHPGAAGELTAVASEVRRNAGRYRYGTWKADRIARELLIDPLKTPVDGMTLTDDTAPALHRAFAVGVPGHRG